MALTNPAGMRGRARRPLFKQVAGGENTYQGLGQADPLNTRAGINNINAILHSTDYATLNRRCFIGGAISHKPSVLCILA